MSQSIPYLHRISPGDSLSPGPRYRGQTLPHPTLAALFAQLRTDYAQQAIDLRSQRPNPSRLQIQLRSPLGLSPLAAQAIGQRLGHTLRRERATLLAHQICQVQITVANRQGKVPVWQTTIALAAPNPGARRVSLGASPSLPAAASAPPIVKLGQWLVLGCHDFLQSNWLLLTFLFSGWLYAAIALNAAPSTPQAQAPSVPQPAAIPFPEARGEASSATGREQYPKPAGLDPVEIAATTNALTFTVPEVFQGKTLYRVNPIRARKVIALTFSQGPWPNNTEEILAILRRYHVKATFFWVGQAVAEHPDLARQVVAHGHAIGNHPWSRPDQPAKRSAIGQEIQRTAQAIQQTTGVTSSLFRPSTTPFNEALQLQAQRQQYTTILWSVDAGEEDSSDAIVDRVLQDASSGAIVQMTEGGGDRLALIQALPQIITLLRRQGYQFLTVPQLLEQQTNLQTRPI